MENNDYGINLVKLAESDGGGWLAEVTDLPGCVSDGDSPEEALLNAKDAIKCWIAAARAEGQVIPQPAMYDCEEYSGKILLRLPKTMHKMLIKLSRQEGVSLNQYMLYLLSSAVGTFTKPKRHIG